MILKRKSKNDKLERKLFFSCGGVLKLLDMENSLHLKSHFFTELHTINTHRG